MNGFKRRAYALATACALLLACAAQAEDAQAAGPVDTAGIAWKAKDAYTPYETEAVRIALADGETQGGAGYAVQGDVITITQAGTYALTGTLTDGQIVVDAARDEDVRLVLENVNIACTNGAPIYVKQADKVIVSLPDGTSSALTDSATAMDEEGREISAALFCRSSLTINGSGSLRITARARDGIATKDTLKLAGGVIAIEAADDGIVAKDRALIQAGEVTIVSAGDGIKTTGTDADKGYFYIEGGRLNITAEGDGIQAATSALIAGGEIAIRSGGGSENAGPRAESFGGRGGRGPSEAQTATQTEDETISMKGIKAGAYLDVTGGSITIDSCDDSLHSDGIVRISGGTITLSTGDDGVHADERLEIGGGVIDVADSYEGLEAAIVEISGGEISLRAQDDGINAAGGSDGSQGGGFFGRDTFATGMEYRLHIGGGVLYVDASGDGLDANGALTIDGGTVYVSGPTSMGDGTFDADGVFTIDGGLLLGAGSAGMAQTPSGESKQPSITVTGGPYAAGSEITVQDAAGNVLVAWAPAKDFASVTFSSEDIKLGSTYRVYVDGELMQEIEVDQMSAGEGGGFGGSRGGRRGGW